MLERLRIPRRTLLLSAAAWGMGCNTEKPHEGLLGAMERWNLRVQRGLFSPSRIAPTARLDQLTADKDFPAYFISPSVPLAPAGWVLEVGGQVERPMQLSFDDLRRMTRTDVRVEHHCVEGWSAVASWNGVQLREIARFVGARPDARFVEFRSFDGDYYSSWDRESAEHAQTLLAYGMNGDLLTAAHGAPLRLYGSVKLGYKSVKYLTKVTFLPNATGGYWEDRGYEWFAGV